MKFSLNDSSHSHHDSNSDRREQERLGRHAGVALSGVALCALPDSSDPMRFAVLLAVMLASLHLHCSCRSRHSRPKLTLLLLLKHMLLHLVLLLLHLVLTH